MICFPYVDQPIVIFGDSKLFTWQAYYPPPDFTTVRYRTDDGDIGTASSGVLVARKF